MAQLFWSTTANINNGNQNAPVTGRQAVIIQPDNSTADAGNNQIGSNVVTPLQISTFVGTQAGLTTTIRDLGSVDTTRWAYANINSKVMQIGNYYIMFGPGVRFDCSGWNIDIFDNGNRFGGFQIGGTEGNTVLVNDTILGQTDPSWVSTPGRLGNTSTQGTLTPWQVAKAQIFLDRTSIRYIKNVAGTTGGAATASFTLALNGEVVLANRPSYISAFGTQASVESLGVGFHPTAAAGTTFTNRAMVSTTGWRPGTGANGSWSGASLIQNGTSTTGSAVALKFDANNLTINEPRIIQQDGGTLEFYSEAQETGVSTGTKWRFNTSGAFSGTTLTIDEFNHGGGVFAINTSALSFVNQGSGHLNQQVFATGRSTAAETATLGVTSRSNDLVFDAWDYGTRTISPSGTGDDTGHWDSFKRRYFNISIPPTINDADLGTDSLYRAYIRSGQMSASTRFTEDQDIALLGDANFMADGTFRYTPAFLARNFTGALNTKANVNRAANNNNRFYFEGTETSALRIPESFYNSNDTTTTQSVRKVDEVIHSYIQYPYIPMLVTEQVQDLSFGVEENVDSTFAQGLTTPTYINVTNQATVSGYGFLGTVNQTIDRAYYNYLEEVKLDAIADVITNSNLASSFYLNGSSATSIIYTAGDIEFVESVPLQELVRLNGTAIEIQATANYEGNITASNPTATFENSATQLISYGEGNISCANIDSENFIFNGTNLTADISVIGDAVFNGVTVNGDMAITGAFQGGSVHNSPTNTFDSTGLINDAELNGITTITGEIIASTVNGTADLTNGETGTTVYGDTCNLLGATVNNGNTFNGNVTNAPLAVTNQTFGDVEIFPIAGVLGTWETNTFNSTTILLNENVDVRSWSNTGAVTFTANQAQTITLTTVQMDSGDYVLGNLVTFDIQDPDVPSIVRTVTAPTTGRLYIRRQSDNTAVVGTINGLTLGTGGTFDVVHSGTGDVFTATDVVRVFFLPQDTSFQPTIYDTIIGELAITVTSRNSLLYASSTVNDVPGAVWDLPNNRLTISLPVNETNPADSQRLILATLTTQAAFDMFYDVNEALAPADFILNFLDGSTNGATSILGDYVSLASNNLSATILDQRTLVDVIDSDTNADFIVTFTGVLLASVLISASNQATTGQLQVLIRAETDKVIENQSDINTKINGTSLAVGAIPASGDLPNTSG